MRLALVALLAALAFASPAFSADDDAAKDAPPACMKDGAPVPDDYMQLGRDMMVVTKANDRMTQILDAMLPSVIEMARKTQPDISNEDLTTFMAMVREEMVKALPRLVDANACLYIEHFSREELAGIVAWYRSPLGQKVIAENPAIVKEALPLGRAWGEQAGRAAIQREIARYRSKGEHT
jgi:hypothetical protein